MSDPAPADSSAPTPGPLFVWGSFATLILIWGTTWGVIRIGLHGVPPFTGLALRFALAAVVLFAAARPMGVRFGRHRMEPRLWAILAAFSFCGSYGAVYWSEQWVPSGLAAVLFATFPLLVAPLAHLFLPDERLSVAGAAGALVGFAGVAVIFSEDLAKLGGPGVTRGALVFLISPIVSSVGYVATKKWGAGIPPLSLAAVPQGIAALVMGAVALTVERHETVTWTGPNVSALLYLGICGSALTFSLYYRLLQFTPATRLSLITFLIPVVAVIFGALVLDEPLTLRVALGAALVVAGVGVAGRKKG